MSKLTIKSLINTEKEVSFDFSKVGFGFTFKKTSNRKNVRDKKNSPTNLWRGVFMGVGGSLRYTPEILEVTVS